MEKILVYGSFKTATHTMTNTLMQCLNPAKYEITRKHLEPHFLKRNGYSYIFYMMRNQEDIYQSAFFQDIIEPAYSYSPFLTNLKTPEEIKKIIKNVDVDYLVNIYLKHDWKKESHLDVKTGLEEMLEAKGYNKFYKFPDTYYLFHNIILLNVNFINNPNFFNLLENDLALDVINKNIVNSNVGKTKWYSDKYIEFREILRQKKE